MTTRNRNKSFFLGALSVVLLGHGCLDSNHLGYVSDSANDDTVDTSSDADNKDTSTSFDFEVCASKDYEVGLAPLDIVLALDTSGSMDYSPPGQLFSKWDAVKGALKSFVKNPSMGGMGVGIQYFPIRKECNEDEYARPAVEIAQLPDAAPDIEDSLDVQGMSSGTPMFPMLQGVLSYTSDWAVANPDRRVVVVMATDGIPDTTCLSSDPALSNTLENVEALVATAASADPPVDTFVIGVGSELTALNRISQAGNGEGALLVDLSADDIEAALLTAFESIRLRSACRYEIANLTSGEEFVDPKKVNIVFADETNEDFLVFVNDETSCYLAPENGWYYDDQNNPTQIILCEETCAEVQSRIGNEIKFVFGCETIVPS